jgi:hypothetical protein
MTHILLSLSDEATRQAWGTAETASLIRPGIVTVLTVLVIGRSDPHSLGRTA